MSADTLNNKCDAENLPSVVDEYLHWRKVNPQIKGGENYLKRLREAMPKRESVTKEPIKYKCSNPHCGAIYFYIPHGHCPACKEEGGTGYSCYPINSIEGG